MIGGDRVSEAIFFGIITFVLVLFIIMFLTRSNRVAVFGATVAAIVIMIIDPIMRYYELRGAP